MDFDRVARGWDKWWPMLERGTGSVSRRLIELAQVGPGDRVLDIATGLGEPALEAAERTQPGGEVVAVDVSPQMLELARRRAERLDVKNVRFVQSDAAAYAEGEPFDAILSRWGMMFLPDLDASLRHYRHQLKPGGRMAVAVWGKAAEVPLISLGMRVAGEALGEAAPPPNLNDPFSLHDTAALQARFTASGFVNVGSEDIEVLAEFASAHQFLEHVTDVAPPVMMLMDRLDDTARTRVSRAIEQTAAERFGRPNGSLAMPNRAAIVVGFAP